jgi:hypothetical protein
MATNGLRPASKHGLEPGGEVLRSVAPEHDRDISGQLRLALPQGVPRAEKLLDKRGH